MKKMIFWIFLHVHEYFSIKFLKNFFFFQENIRKLLFFEVNETFYSYFSKANVVRGIYMQTGKDIEAKLLTLIHGDLTWVIVDMRKKSKHKTKTRSTN